MIAVNCRKRCSDVSVITFDLIIEFEFNHEEEEEEELNVLDPTTWKINDMFDTILTTGTIYVLMRIDI